VVIQRALWPTGEALTKALGGAFERLEAKASEQDHSVRG